VQYIENRNQGIGKGKKKQTKKGKK